MIIQNPFAPHLTGTVSPAAQALISEHERTHYTNPYATRDSDIIRREPARDEASCLRPAFVRDVEKIIHTPAYNRLAGKTQVFSFRPNDDLTRRNLHVQLVARIARDIGRALSLNLDLIEAQGLGHDIGHAPFGHIGERFLKDELLDRFELGIGQVDVDPDQLFQAIQDACFLRSNKQMLPLPQAIGRVRSQGIDDQLLREHANAWSEAHRA